MMDMVAASLKAFRSSGLRLQMSRLTDIEPALVIICSMKDGCVLGSDEGDTVGVVVGLVVGDIVGDVDGDFVGDVVGSVVVGLDVGKGVVGLAVGEFVGAEVGTREMDGTRLGAVLGEVVGALQANDCLSNNTQLSSISSHVSPIANFMVFHSLSFFVVAVAPNVFVNPSASMSG